jgi:membrane associated rhomboid family serine protease
MLALPLLLVIALLAALLQPIVPLHRRRSEKRDVPAVTLLVILLNLIVYASGPSFDALGLVPSRVAPQTLITYLFVHGDLMHLMGNLIGLWLVGVPVEEALGAARFLLFYLVGGVFAGLCHVLLSRLSGTGIDAALVGASGAIFALLGLFSVRFWRTKVRLFWLFPLPAFLATLIVIVIQLVLAFRASGDQTSYVSHLAGIALGIALAFPLRMLDDSERDYGIEDAAIAAARGEFDKAMGYYRKLAARQPEDSSLHHAMALLSVKLNHDEAAHRHFTDAIAACTKNNNAIALTKIIADARSLLPHFVLPARLLPRVAGLCEEAEQFQLAQSAYTALLRDFPHHTDAEMAHLKLAKLHLYKLNQPGNAVAILTEFLRTYPESEWASHARTVLTEAERKHVD